MIQRADTLREVSRLANFMLPSALYVVTEARNAQRRVIDTAVDRAKELINEQIEVWSKAEPEYRGKHRAAMYEDWTHLTGNLGHLRTWAQRQFTTAEQNRLD